MIKSAILILALGLLGAACATSRASEPLPTSTTTAIDTAIPIATLIPAATATAMPTAAPIDTPEPAATPADEKPKRSQTVKSLRDSAEETHDYDRKAVYDILGGLTNEAGIQDIGLREAAERIRDHHDNPSADEPEGGADAAWDREHSQDSGKAPSPDKPEDAEFREED